MTEYGEANDIADEAEKALNRVTMASAPLDSCLLTTADIRYEVREELRSFARESLRAELCELQKNLRQDFREVVDVLCGNGVVRVAAKDSQPLGGQRMTPDESLPGLVPECGAAEVPTDAGGRDAIVEKLKRELDEMFQDFGFHHSSPNWDAPQNAASSTDAATPAKNVRGSCKPSRLSENDDGSASGRKRFAQFNTKVGSAAKLAPLGDNPAPAPTKAHSSPGSVGEALASVLPHTSKDAGSLSRTLSGTSQSKANGASAGWSPKSSAKSLGVDAKLDSKPQRSVFMSTLNKTMKDGLEGGQEEVDERFGNAYMKQKVESTHFDVSSGLAVALNAIWIGIQTDESAGNKGGSAPGYFAVIDTLFCLVFLGELICRIIADGRKFLSKQGWHWNAFDTTLVSMQIAEEFMSRLVDDHGGQSSNFSFMRILRVLRLIRVIRLVRIVRLISEFKTIVSSIMGSLRSLLWTIVLLIMFIYVIGIFFTQAVTDYGPDHEVLGYYYGSLPRSLLSLFEAFTGGADWDLMAQALITGVHPLMGLFFAFYIAFAVLAMMNVVTGVFVENALATARQDKDSELVACLCEIFKASDDEEDHNGMISREEFDRLVHGPRMLPVLEAIDVAVSEAQGLFELIDVDGSGEISRDEFIMGCLRLKGAAKAMDLATLMYDNRRFSNVMEEHMWLLEQHMDALDRIMVHIEEMASNSHTKLSRLSEGFEGFAEGLGSRRTSHVSFGIPQNHHEEPTSHPLVQQGVSEPRQPPRRDPPTVDAEDV